MPRKLRDSGDMTPKFLNPIYNKTATYEGAEQHGKVAIDRLSEGRPQKKSIEISDIREQLDTPRGSADSGKGGKASLESSQGGSQNKDSDLQSATDDTRIFGTDLTDSMRKLEKYKSVSILYQMQNSPMTDEICEAAKILTNLPSRIAHISGLRFLRGHRDHQHIFSPIRNTAVMVLKNRLLDFLTVYQMKNTYDMNPSQINYKIPHNLFSWSYKDFIRRRRIKNTAYIDVLMTELSANELDTLKLKTDIEEAKRIINKLFECEETGKRNVQTFMKVIMTDMVSLDSLLNIENKLINIIEAYISADENDKCVLDFIRNQKDYAKELQKIALETKLIDIKLWNPIELRYSLNWIQAKQDQCEMKAKEQTDLLSKKIQDELYEKDLYQLSARSTIDATYTLIEVLKVKINEMNHKYSVDFDAIDNKNVYLQKRIDNLEAEKKFLTFEIQRFHEEIEAMRQRDYEEEQKRLEMEAKKPKKKGKGKKGKKGKDGKKGKKKEAENENEDQKKAGGKKDKKKK